MAAVRTEEELDRLMDEVRDRYGPPPDSVLNLAEYAAIRVLADRIRLESIDRDGQAVVLKFRPDAKLDPAWLFRVVQQRGDVTLLPPATLKLDLRGPEKKAEPMRKGAGTARKGGDPVAGGSWWAARAKAGQVAPGFSRDEIMRPAKEDPKAEGGVFSRVGGVLRELSAGPSIN
jgi:transcription-repair coupling factor (superfamily II helicase)